MSYERGAVFGPTSRSLLSLQLAQQVCGLNSAGSRSKPPPYITHRQSAFNFNQVVCCGFACFTPAAGCSGWSAYGDTGAASARCRQAASRALRHRRPHQGECAGSHTGKPATPRSLVKLPVAGLWYWRALASKSSCPGLIGTASPCSISTLPVDMEYVMPFGMEAA